MKRDHDNHDCIDFNHSATIGECDNTNSTPMLVPGNRVRIIRVPVALAQITVTSNLVANIHFPEPVLEIKDIKKRIEIVQCRLITRSVSCPSFSSAGETFPLVLKGFVRKNIQYATPSCPSGDHPGSCVSSDIKSLTVRVPFECVTQVRLSAPILLPVQNARNEFDFFRAQDLGEGFPEKDQFLSSDLSQFHQESTQFYNQLPFCELISSRIVEWDESTNRSTSLFGNHGPVGEGTFDKMVEKMFLNFTIKVLQNQQMAVTTTNA